MDIEKLSKLHDAQTEIRQKLGIENFRFNKQGTRNVVFVDCQFVHCDRLMYCKEASWVDENGETLFSKITYQIHSYQFQNGLLAICQSQNGLLVAYKSKNEFLMAYQPQNVFYCSFNPKTSLVSYQSQSKLLVAYPSQNCLLVAY